MPDYSTNQQIVEAARRNLSQGAWDYLVGAADSETTMRRNRLAFDRYAFRARILNDVSQIDPSTTFLGQRLRIPVLLAPLGYTQLLTPEGALASAHAAGEFGTIHTLSSLTQPGIEAVGAATAAPKLYQLYVRGDIASIRDVVQRVKDAGFIGLVLTVDTARVSRRERAMLSGSNTPGISSQFPEQRAYQAAVTWDTLDRLKELAAPMSLLLKGVATAEDAALAVQHGVDVVWVSNHGGRQLDYGLGSLDTLPEIVDAVAGRARIILDGGIQRGSDVAKALALGADAVAIGKLQGWGAAAAGQAGITRVLEILESELITAMGLLGVTSIGQLGPQHLTDAEPVAAPHEMSSWVNLPGGRLT